MLEEIDRTYKRIEDKILNHEIYQNVKDYSKTKEKQNRKRKKTKYKFL